LGTKTFGLDEAACAGLRRASTTAGIALLVAGPLAVYGHVVLDGWWVDDDPHSTAYNVGDAAGLVAVVGGCLLVAALGHVVAGWALQALFAPVDPGLARLSAWCRALHAAVAVVAAGLLRSMGDLANGDLGTDPQSAVVRLALVDDVLGAAGLLLGSHLLLVGYLAFRSGYVPATIGVLVALGGVGHVIGGLCDVPVGWFVVGEAPLLFWLLSTGAALRPESMADTGRSYFAPGPAG
jgi:hypothetical protein